MSNIKEIDGVFVNLDNITSIEIDKPYKKTSDLSNKIFYRIKFIFNSITDEWTLESFGNIKYKTEEEADLRIMEIIKNQNKE